MGPAGARSLRTHRGVGAFDDVLSPSPVRSRVQRTGETTTPTKCEQSWSSPSCLCRCMSSERSRTGACRERNRVEAHAEPHPAGTEVAVTTALSLARERFAEKRASGSRPRRVVRRSCFRPEAGANRDGATLMLCQGLRARASTRTSLPVRTKGSRLGGGAPGTTRHAPFSSGPGARSALTRVAARPCERESGALAGRRGQAGSKHTRGSRNRGKGGQPVWPFTTPDRRGRGDAHL